LTTFSVATNEYRGGNGERTEYQLHPPTELMEIDDGDDASRRHIEQRRARVVDAYVDDVIDKAERDQRLRKLDDEADALAARTYLEAIPVIDWNWPPAEMNGVLRAMWEHIELDADMRPVDAVWRVPEWRQ